MTDVESGPISTDASVLAPRTAPGCRCAARDVIAFRDEDGDWSCYSCGRLLRPSMARRRHIRPAATGGSLLAGQLVGSRR
jgi:hypothetical protein